MHVQIGPSAVHKVNLNQLSRMVSYMVEQLEHAQQRRDASLNVEKVAENSNTPNQ